MVGVLEVKQRYLVISRREGQRAYLQRAGARAGALGAGRQSRPEGIERSMDDVEVGQEWTRKPTSICGWKNVTAVPCSQLADSHVQSTEPGSKWDCCVWNVSATHSGVAEQ